MDTGLPVESCHSHDNDPGPLVVTFIAPVPSPLQLIGIIWSKLIFKGACSGTTTGNVSTQELPKSLSSTK